MRRKIFSIWSVLLVLIVSIAVLVPGCAGDGGEEEMCEIWVSAYLCDDPWTGPVEYTLTGPGAASPITGTNVSAFFFGGEYCGEWTCAYVSGGPPGAYYVDITPSPTQSVSDGGIINFYLNFELEQDASIEFTSWAINGPEVKPNDPHNPYGVTTDDIIEAHYTQLVDGCEGKEVSVKETSELLVHCYFLLGGPSVGGRVVGDKCAVFKDPPMTEPVSLEPSIDGASVSSGDTFSIEFDRDVTLDVVTAWLLEKSIMQDKFIRWLYIGDCREPQCCALFELFGGPGSARLELRSRASVELVDDEDVDPNNNSSGWSPSLYIEVQW